MFVHITPICVRVNLHLHALQYFKVKNISVKKEYTNRFKPRTAKDTISNQLLLNQKEVRVHTLQSTRPIRKFSH